MTDCDMLCMIFFLKIVLKYIGETTVTAHIKALELQEEKGQK